MLIDSTPVGWHFFILLLFFRLDALNFYHVHPSKISEMMISHFFNKCASIFIIMEIKINFFYNVHIKNKNQVINANRKI